VCNPGGRVRVVCFGYLVGNSRRPCISFDVDLPTEVDDEYWENEQEPESAFKQPTGKPSLLSYFVSLIKLFHILAIALRTIVSQALIMLLYEALRPYRQYSINKSKIFLGFVGPHWEQHIVAELDSTLNEWIDKVPEHRAYFCSSTLAKPLITLDSQMGYNGPELQGSPMVPSVRKPI
jgi:hypothetical protein